MFLKIDREKARRKGSVYVAQIGNRVVVGRTRGTTTVSALVGLAAEVAKGKKLPEITLIKFKKVSDTYKAEAYLHSALYEYADSNNYYKGVSNAEIDIVWKDMV